MKDLIYKEAKIPFCTRKFFNLQIGCTEDEYYEYFDFTCKWTKNQDHAGFNLNLGLWKLYFIFYTYDNRHWCMDCEDYMKESCYTDHENMKENLIEDGWKYYESNPFNNLELYTFGEITDDCGHKIPRFNYCPSKNSICVNDGGNMGCGWFFKAYNYDDIQNILEIVEKK